MRLVEINMEEQKEHNAIMIALGELKQEVGGINRRLDILNGSVAKHADKWADQQVINSQVTMTQKHLVEESEDDASTKKIWLERLFWSVVVPAVSFLVVLVLTKLGILNI